MHKVLLVWNEVPENLKLYLLDEVSDDEFGKLKRCHGQMMNQVDLDGCVEEALRWLNKQLDEDGPWCGKKVYDDSCDGDVVPPIEVPGVAVIVSGFIM